MSQENVELARRLYEEAAADFLHATGDQIDDAFREFLHDQFEFRLPPDYPGGELAFRGRDGISQLIAVLSETWGETLTWGLGSTVIRKRNPEARTSASPSTSTSVSTRQSK